MILYFYSLHLIIYSMFHLTPTKIIRLDIYNYIVLISVYVAFMNFQKDANLPK